MNKKNILLTIGVLALVAAAIMKWMGGNSHTTELQRYWWYPLPLALICFIIAGGNKK